jgi:nucleotidyltransferase substrate binding protein (TIGR01987 family)
MAIDLTSLENSIFRFCEGLVALRERPKDALTRDGVIQRFEFTYDLSHKMLKRYLEMASPTPAEFDSKVFADLIRTGNEQGLLLSGWDKWRDFRQARTNTSHSYDDGKAVLVVDLLPSFKDEAQFLLKQLQDRSNRG